MEYECFEFYWKEIVKTAAKNGDDLSKSKFATLQRKYEDKEENIKISGKMFANIVAYVGEPSFRKAQDDYGNYEKEKQRLEKEKFEVIGFLGREKEFQILEDFLKNKQKKIFALYGVPMIGKTQLTKHFILENATAKNWKTIRVRLNPDGRNPEKFIYKRIFGKEEIQDFDTKFTSATLLVIENFEDLLQRTGNTDELHDLRKKYNKIINFLLNLGESQHCKIILESRFQVNFMEMPDLQKFVMTFPKEQKGELKEIDTDLFWQYYQRKDFSRDEFDKLCHNFDKHTAILALAYNHADLIYDYELKRALRSPELATQRLWKNFKNILEKLPEIEKSILITLALSKNSIPKFELRQIIYDLDSKAGKQEVENYLFSLRRKLLVQWVGEEYQLNPLVQEITFTYFDNHAKDKKLVQQVKQLQYFKENGFIPKYDKARQAREQGDYGEFYRLIKEKRKTLIM